MKDRRAELRSKEGKPLPRGEQGSSALPEEAAEGRRLQAGGPEEDSAVQSRRGFLRSLAVGAGDVLAGAAGGLSAGRRAPSKIPGLRDGLGIVRPPGSIDEEDFLASCERCTECVDACEVDCIALFGEEAGRLAGTPYILPADKACTMCMDCAAACPTEAMTPPASMEETAMGVAVIDHEVCVAYNGSGVCGACYTACPLRSRAIREDFRSAPIVDTDNCTGCGLCEELCFVGQPRAIHVISARNAAPAVLRAIVQAATPAAGEDA